MTRRTAIVGRGRAGGALALALGGAGWPVTTWAHTDAAVLAPEDAELVVLCVPDSAVREVAASLAVSAHWVVAHCAGALTLEALSGHPRVASVHPLVALADPTTGAESLRGAWFATAGDAMAAEVVDALDGRRVEVPDDQRVAYHAAAVVASNHLVALMGQVERIAAEVGVPLEAYLDLATGALARTAAVGPAAALTGPVWRGDWATVAAHVAVLPDDEVAAYLAMAAEAARLCGRTLPEELAARIGR